MEEDTRENNIEFGYYHGNKFSYHAFGLHFSLTATLPIVLFSSSFPKRRLRSLISTVPFQDWVFSCIKHQESLQKSLSTSYHS